ncbi:hypothetical protein SCHPADRAFT_905801 [Schizopora paradoxa]|uniref:Transforming acidic coiled-coil-containing protein C-terminal domain-containing protein n=1 Tax=Schizopora paradoxa TaxID=27342 RepID=A0A0H2S417_9AGAM|nr:hypothetical protein SCHPADRAFT_905801 [Schizopora paradoxa]
MAKISSIPDSREESVPEIVTETEFERKGKEGGTDDVLDILNSRASGVAESKESQESKSRLEPDTSESESIISCVTNLSTQADTTSLNCGENSSDYETQVAKVEEKFAKFWDKYRENSFQIADLRSKAEDYNNQVLGVAKDLAVVEARLKEQDKTLKICEAMLSDMRRR